MLHRHLGLNFRSKILPPPFFLGGGAPSRGRWPNLTNAWLMPTRKHKIWLDLSRGGVNSWYFWHPGTLSLTLSPSVLRWTTLNLAEIRVNHCWWTGLCHICDFRLQWASEAPCVFDAIMNDLQRLLKVTLFDRTHSTSFLCSTAVLLRLCN